MYMKLFSVQMFAKLVMDFLKFENVVDYYDRIQIKAGNDGGAVLRRHLNNTFKHGKVYKMGLSEIELEKLNKTYLLFKNDLKAGERKFSFILFDEFIKNIPIKSSFKISEEIENNFFTGNYQRKYLLSSLVVIEEYLGHDKKYINLYVNQNCYAHLCKMLRVNKVKWYQITDADREIIKRGNFSLRYMKFIKKIPEIKTAEDVEAVTLKDVLNVVPLKSIIYEDWVRTNEQKTDIIINYFYDHCTRVDNEVKIELIKHLRKILIPLFEQTPQEEETFIEDY